MTNEQRSEAGSKGGKASVKAQVHKAHAGRKRQAAAARAAKAKPAEKKAEAPLPAWLTGYKRGLPMKPPGKPADVDLGEIMRRENDLLAADRGGSR